MARLGEVTETRPGYPFRGAINDATGGDVSVVQIKNVDPEQGVEWGALLRTFLAGRKQPDWLENGDVLFIARGNRNVAVHLDQVPDRAVCAPQFYLLRVKGDRVLPAYLAWYLNEHPAQRYFEQSAEGSVVTSIRRQVLESLPLPIPNLERQQVIVNLVDAARREKQITKQLIRNREHQLALVARSLIE
tara:strand:+ start:37080 stop:37646 length:567 start_codon:yes stop_codon:yes gene_type:complete